MGVATLAAAVGCTLVAACGRSHAPADDAPPDRRLDYERLRAEVTFHVEPSGAPGWAYGVVEDGEVRDIETHGERCIDEPGSTVGPSTLFRTVRLQRLLTAIAVLEAAAAEESIRLDAPVAEHVGDVGLRPAEWADDITLRHLLTERSGLPRGFGSGCATGETTLEQRVGELDGRWMGAPAGKWNMRNQYARPLAAHVLAQATGLTFAEAVRRYVLDPLGLESARFERDEAKTDAFACGHRAEEPVVYTSEGSSCEAAQATSLGYISIEDLARLAQILANGGRESPGGPQLLEPTTVDALLAGDYESWVSKRCGRSHAFYVWPTEETGPIAVIQGGEAGFGSALVVAPRERFAFVAVLNVVSRRDVRPRNVSAMIGPALETLLGVDIPMLWNPRPRWTPDGEVLETMAGAYETVCGMRLDVSVSGDRLVGEVFTPEGLPHIKGAEALPVLEDRFQISGEPGVARARLWRDGDDAPSAMWIDAAALEHPFWRAPPNVAPAGCE